MVHLDQRPPPGALRVVGGTGRHVTCQTLQDTQTLEHQSPAKHSPLVVERQLEGWRGKVLLVLRKSRKPAKNQQQKKEAGGGWQARGSLQVEGADSRVFGERIVHFVK